MFLDRWFNSWFFRFSQRLSLPLPSRHLVAYSIFDLTVGTGFKSCLLCKISKGTHEYLKTCTYACVCMMRWEWRELRSTQRDNGLTFCQYVHLSGRSQTQISEGNQLFMMCESMFVLSSQTLIFVLEEKTDLAFARCIKWTFNC